MTGICGAVDLISRILAWQTDSANNHSVYKACFDPNVDILQSNSMVEAANKLLKYRYLFPKPIIHTTALTQTIEQALESYNNMRTGSCRMPSFTY